MSGGPKIKYAAFNDFFFHETEQFKAERSIRIEKMTFTTFAKNFFYFSKLKSLIILMVIPLTCLLYF